MSELINTPGPTVVDFGIAAAPHSHCSRHICPNGHEWSAKFVVVACPGCNEHMAALLMVNCPICNEPTAKTFLRVDYLPQGGAITPICKGSDTLAETTMVALEHSHHTAVEKAYIERPMVSKV